MRRSILVIAIALPLLGYSQEKLKLAEDTGGKLRWGIKLGISIANAQVESNNPNSPYHENYGSKTGAIFGGYLSSDLKKNIRFQPSVMYVRKGVKNIDNNRIYLNYLELPLNMLYLFSSSTTTFFIGGGPAPSFLLNDAYDYYYGIPAFDKIDFGINVLAGFEIPIGFSLNLNYTHGLVNISADRDFRPVFRNRSFGITAGYTF